MESKLKQLNRGFICQNNNTDLIERVLQFGEGNFLRAFIDVFIDELNENGYFNGSIVIVQPIAQGMANDLNTQDGCYTVVLRGLENGTPVVRKRVVTSVRRAINPYTDYDTYINAIQNPHLRFVVSNTTEAGIAFAESDKLDDRPPSSFPAKIIALLYERYKLFNGDLSKGFILLPCELIDNNGDTLKEIVLRYAAMWQLSQEFIDWVTKANYFANTLVDRIVTGYPSESINDFESELGYRDNLLVTGEVFHFLAIEAPKEALREISDAMPFHKLGLNVALTSDVTPYKLRKVRILNGGHTMSVLGAFLSGINTVGEMMDDPLFVNYLQKGISQEIIPTLDLDEENLKTFAASVFDRFANPYIKHNILSIALNSVSKFSARILPTILDYHKKTGQLPELLCFSFAALLAFYKVEEIRDGTLIGIRGNSDEYQIADTPDVLAFFEALWHQQSNISKIVTKTCSQTSFWDMDLNLLPGFAEKITEHLQNILHDGVKKTIQKIME